MAVPGSTVIVTKGCSVCLAVADINRMVVDHGDGEAQSIPCIGLAVEFQVLYIGLCPTEQLSWNHHGCCELALAPIFLESPPRHHMHYCHVKW